MTVPIGIDLEQYKAQAKELLTAARLARAEALDRLRANHPGYTARAALAGLKLADAQLVVARENGFASWPRFREYLLFRNAVAALDAGNATRLAEIVDAHPSVLRYECRVGEWYEEGYFSGATLLQHIAGNPGRVPLPRNIVDVARLIVDRHFDRKAAEYTIGLLLTSRQASESGVALPLIDVLTEAGAHFDPSAPDVLTGPLLNLAPGTAKALMSRGAKIDLCNAAAMGDLTALRGLLETSVSREKLDEALAFACIRDQREATALLLAHGAKGDVLVTPGGQTARTALHEAANRGFAVLVDLLVASGASAVVRDAQWDGTAAGWAEEGGFPEIARRLRATP